MEEQTYWGGADVTETARQQGSCGWQLMTRRSWRLLLWLHRVEVDDVQGARMWQWARCLEWGPCCEAEEHEQESGFQMQTPFSLDFQALRQEQISFLNLREK